MNHGYFVKAFDRLFRTNGLENARVNQLCAGLERYLREKK